MQRSTGEMGLDYWMKWQVLVCGFIIVTPTIVAIKLISKNRTSPTWNQAYLWLPCWKKLSPKWLLFYRAFAFFSMAFLLYNMILLFGLFAFHFYTQLTFTLVMIYFGVGTIVSAQGCLKSSKKALTENKEKDAFLEVSESKRSDDSLHLTETEKHSIRLQHDNNDYAHKEAGVLGSLMLIIYQMSAGASVLTDLVFWCILVPMMAGKQFELTLLIGAIHSLNAVFLIIDSLLNALPFEWFGLNYFILWSATYVSYQWIIHACGVTWWPYPFLDLATPWAPLWYLGLALVHVPCYAVYLFFVKAKNYILPKLFQQAFVIRSQHQKAA